MRDLVLSGPPGACRPVCCQPDGRV